MYSGTGSGSSWDARELDRPSDALPVGFGTEPSELLGVSCDALLSGFDGYREGCMWDVDASHQRMQLQGDWFHEPDTTRGVAVANPGVLGALSYASEAGAFDGYGDAWGIDESHRDVRLPGDWFCETDNIKRGFTVANPGLLGELSLAGEKAADFHDLGDGWWRSQEDDCPAGDAARDLEGAARQDAGAQACIENPTFTDAMQPAEVPCCGASSTSVDLECQSAAQVASAVYTFLTTEVKSAILKVRTQKFSIKAYVSIEVAGCPCPCTLKVRILRAAGGPEGARLVAEFSRRSGDSVGFHHVFEQAANFIQQRFGSPSAGVGGEKATEPPALTEVLTGDISPDDLQPLLDMVGEADAPMVQAEALASLAALAGASAAGTAVVLAVWSHLREVLAGLMLSTEVTVAYPASCLARELASQGGGETVAKRLVLAALQGGQADGLCSSPVRSQLAEVVRVGTLRAAEVAPSMYTSDIHCALKQVLSSVPVNQVEVRGRLQEALLSLEVAGPACLELPMTATVA